MSRDWTPLQHYLVEQRQIQQGHGDIFAFMESMKIVHEGGAEVTVNPPEEMALRRQFPCLGKYLFDEFLDLHQKLSQFNGGLEFLHEKDRDLAEYIESGTGDKDSYLVKWFEGKLDEHFYYSERNNEMLIAKMCEEALQKGLSNWVLTDPDCLQVRRQTGFEGRGVFELIQIDQIPAASDSEKSVYLIADGEIDLDDYTQEEIDSTLDCYGYEDLKELIRAAGSRSEADGQLAEMFFELSTSLHTMRFNSWDEALEHIEYRTGTDWSAFRESAKDSLAARLVDFYKGYDLYDYRDSLAPGATDEDAIHYMEEQLKEPTSVNGILEALEELAEDPDLDEDQKEVLSGLLEDVNKVKQTTEGKTERKKPLAKQIQAASVKVDLSKDACEDTKSRDDHPELQ